MSDIYYAMFHTLCRECANSLVGASRRNSEPWSRAYRAVDHKAAKDVLRQQTTQRIDPAVAAFGTLFILLQDARHVADYDPRPFPHKTLQVIDFRDQAKLAIEGLCALSAEHKLSLAAAVLFKQRS